MIIRWVCTFIYRKVCCNDYGHWVHLTFCILILRYDCWIFSLWGGCRRNAIQTNFGLRPYLLCWVLVAGPCIRMLISRWKSCLLWIGIVTLIGFIQLILKLWGKHLLWEILTSLNTSFGTTNTAVFIQFSLVSLFVSSWPLDKKWRLVWSCLTGIRLDEVNKSMMMKIVGYVISKCLIARGSFCSPNDGFFGDDFWDRNHCCWFECRDYYVFDSICSLRPFVIYGIGAIVYCWLFETSMKFKSRSKPGSSLMQFICLGFICSPECDGDLWFEPRNEQEEKLCRILENIHAIFEETANENHVSKD